MASDNDVIEAVTDAMVALAKRAETQTSATYAGSYAYAVNQLAEARAWMKSYNQPHGGSAPPSKG